LDQNTAQMVSPRSAGGLEISYRDDGRRLMGGSVTTLGRERRPAVQAERSSASSPAASPFRNVVIQTGGMRRRFVAMRGARFFVRFQFPFPGRWTRR
jgi:hypothetical protein